MVGIVLSRNCDYVNHITLGEKRNHFAGVQQMEVGAKPASYFPQWWNGELRSGTGETSASFVKRRLEALFTDGLQDVVDSTRIECLEGMFVKRGDENNGGAS